MSAYTRANVGQALKQLATTEGSLKDRLTLAACGLAAAIPAELPPDCREDLEELHRDLGIAGKQEGNVETAIRAMSAADAASAADRIVSLYGSLCELTGKGQH